VNKSKVFSALLLGIKYGVVALLINVAFLPLPIIIGDYFGRIDTVGHYSGPLPASWICGFSIAIAVPYSLPFVFSGCVLSLIIMFSHQTSFIQGYWGRLVGAVLGVFAVVGGSILFERLGLLEALGGWIFVGIMIVWEIVLFGWIGYRIQQRMN